MQSNDFQDTFGSVVQCGSTDEILSKLKATSYRNILERKKVASFGMITIALQVAAQNSFYDDAVELLNNLSRAKTRIDIKFRHEICIVEVTSRLLLRTQQFVDETTVPCTEWPSTEEIAQELIQEAQQLLSEEGKKPVKPPFLLLRDFVQSHDAVIMRVTDLGRQEYVGQIERVYSRRFEGPKPYETEPLKFVGSAGSWGDVTLKNGERAIVFISYLRDSNRYYERHWHGHFTLLDHDGAMHAVANWHLLEHGRQAWGPDYLANSAFLLDPAKPWQVAMPFTLFEAHLLDELSHLA